MKKQESPIYSKIDYDHAHSAKRDVLNGQMEMLNMVRTIEEYKLLRKQELLLKLKLKNDLKKTKENISNFIEKSPKTEVINEAIAKNKEKSKTKKESKGLANVESELEEIQEKLKRME